jgi:DNA-binding transcriptional regulator GbsR (MarR family)
MNAQELEFLELVGRFWEAWGQPRTAGRMLGWLMVCDPPEQSSADLATALGVSAGSVSTITRQLTQIGLVDRVTFPGDRSSYFRLHDHAWIQVMHARLEGIRGLHELAMAAEPLTPEERPDRVTELRFMTEFMLAEWPGLMERMQDQLSERGAVG